MLTIELKGEEGNAVRDFEIKDAQGILHYSGHMKWDGCFELIRWFNGTTPEDKEEDQHADQIHFCSTQSLRDLADLIEGKGVEAFGTSEWGPETP